MPDCQGGSPRTLPLAWACWHQSERSHRSFLMWALSHGRSGGRARGWSPCLWLEPTVASGLGAHLCGDHRGESRTGSSRGCGPGGEPLGESAVSGVSEERLLISRRSERVVVFKTSTCLGKPRRSRRGRKEPHRDPAHEEGGFADQVGRAARTPETTRVLRLDPQAGHGPRALPTLCWMRVSEWAG